MGYCTSRNVRPVKIPMYSPFSCSSTQSASTVVHTTSSAELGGRPEPARATFVPTGPRSGVTVRLPTKLCPLAPGSRASETSGRISRIHTSRVMASPLLDDNPRSREIRAGADRVEPDERAGLVGRHHPPLERSGRVLRGDLPGRGPEPLHRVALSRPRRMLPVLQGEAHAVL